MKKNGITRHLCRCTNNILIFHDISGNVLDWKDFKVTVRVVKGVEILNKVHNRFHSKVSVKKY